MWARGNLGRRAGRGAPSPQFASGRRSSGQRSRGHAIVTSVRRRRAPLPRDDRSARSPRCRHSRIPRSEARLASPPELAAAWRPADDRLLPPAQQLEQAARRLLQGCVSRLVLARLRLAPRRMEPLLLLTLVLALVVALRCDCLDQLLRPPVLRPSPTPLASAHQLGACRSGERTAGRCSAACTSRLASGCAPRRSLPYLVEPVGSIRRARPAPN